LSVPEPLSPVAARCARHIVTRPERYLHLPATARAKLYARAWSILRRARFTPTLRLISSHDGGAA
jgi:hypothetical protein